MDTKTKQVIYKISPNPALNFLKKRDTLLEFDIFNLASIVFNIEKAYKLGKDFNRVEIPISSYTDTDRDFEKVGKLLHDLFLYVLIKDVEIEFKVLEMHKRRRGYNPTFPKCENVCLFSGGVDSLSGLLSSKLFFGDVHSVSVVHGDQTWGSHILDKLYKRISMKEKIPCHTLYAPPMGSSGYSQLRGFLYVLYGAIYISILEAKNLIIAECGPTMYQPRFSPYDTVTMTTHPYVLNTAKQIIEIFLKRKVNIILPYENMTKAEVITASPYKEFFQDSHSCISLRFGTNEGTCYGCTIRRLGFLVAGVGDTEYTRDPIGNKSHNVDNLASLLRFSYDVLFDYKNMPFYSKENILIFKKKDLFKRFALDNFAALYVYKKKCGRLNPYIQMLYNSAMENMREERITNRISKVRQEVIKPNFSKII